VQLSEHAVEQRVLAGKGREVCELGRPKSSQPDWGPRNSIQCSSGLVK